MCKHGVQTRGLGTLCLALREFSWIGCPLLIGDCYRRSWSKRHDACGTNLLYVCPRLRFAVAPIFCSATNRSEKKVNTFFKYLNLKYFTQEELCRQLLHYRYKKIRENQLLRDMMNSQTLRTNTEHLGASPCRHGLLYVSFSSTKSPHLPLSKKYTAKQTSLL